MGKRTLKTRHEHNVRPSKREQCSQRSRMYESLTSELNSTLSNLPAVILRQCLAYAINSLHTWAAVSCISECFRKAANHKSAVQYVPVRLHSKCSDLHCQELSKHGHLHWTSVSLNACNSITDVGVISLASSLTVLHTLDLGYCSMLTDAGVTAVSRSLTMLNTLCLCDCRNLTDTGVATLSSLGALQILDLSRCANITDAGVKSLSLITALKSLNLRACTNITDVTPLSSLTALCRLDLSFCSDNMAALPWLIAPETGAYSQQRPAHQWYCIMPFPWKIIGKT